MKTAKVLFVILIGLLCANCNENQGGNILASQDGYVLTEQIFKNYIQSLEQTKGTLSFVDKDNERAKLLDFFYANPEATLAEIEAITNTVELPEQTTAQTVAQNTQQIAQKSPIKNASAEGHQVVRQVLGSDIGQMQFDTQAANTFRNYVSNSLLTTRSNSSNNGYGSSDYSDSKGQIQFCANGTFVEVLSGHLSIDVEGAGALSSGSDAMPGYWEAAALPNGMFIIVMYSTHPKMLEDSPNGILPFVVSKHGVDFVQLPSGDLYRRTPNQYCN